MKYVFIFLALAFVSGNATLFFVKADAPFYALICFVCCAFTTIFTLIACAYSDWKIQRDIQVRFNS